MAGAAENNGRGALASLVERVTKEPRARSAVGWSEFVPRYLLVEEALAGRHVLEVGTTDVRSLIRLHDAGARRVMGTALDLSVFDRTALRGRTIDVIRMEPGRLDFGDAAFDAILVVDLAKEIAHNPAFLAEVRRILSPSGFAVFGYASTGRSLVDLIGDEPKILPVEPSDLEARIKEVFPGSQFYLQSPFVGVTIQPKGVDPLSADVALEPELAGPNAAPSHVIVLSGRAPEATDRTLVELPYLAFEAMTDAGRERSQSDLSRVLHALKAAREQIAVRDRSLDAIKRRLPKIREALARGEGRTSRPGGEAESSLQGGMLATRPASSAPPSVPSPTVLDRPTEDGRVKELEEQTSELTARLSGLDEALAEERARRRAAEAQLEAVNDTIIQPASSFELEEKEAVIASLQASLEAQRAEVERLRQQAGDDEYERGRLEEEIRNLRRSETERASEVGFLEDRVRDLEAALSNTRRSLTDQEGEAEALAEAKRRVLLLERTASAQEQEIEELRQELESQLVVRHSMGDEFRDAEARVTFLSRRIEDLTLGHAQEMRRAEEQIQFLTQALNEADKERERLNDRLGQLEDGTRALAERSSWVERAQQVSEQERERERAELSLLRDAHDQLRVEAHQKANTIEELRRALADREEMIQTLKEQQSGAGVDRRAVELAASHLSMEVEQLRRRVQELRNERDTLAATSRLLLEERDMAAQVARRAVEAEERAQQLQASLEGGQAAIDRLERERDAALEARSDLERWYLNAEERIRTLEKDLERHRASSEEANGRLGESQHRQRELDQKLASLALEVSEAEAARDRAMQERSRLESMLVEAHQAASLATRDVRRMEERIRVLDEGAKSAEQEVGRALADRARAEAEATRAQAIADDLRGKNALLLAELAEKSEALERAEADRVLEDQLSRAKEALADTEQALSRTLSEAAELDGRLRELERLVEDGERERIQIERQRQEAESRRASADAARADAVAEVRALEVQVERLRFEQEQMLRDLDAAARERARLTAQIDDASAARSLEEEKLREQLARIEEERFALMVWAEELEVSRRLAEANADRLRAESARHAAATESALADAAELDARLEALEREAGIHLADPGDAEQERLRADALQAANADLRSALVVARAELGDQADEAEHLRAQKEELKRRVAAERSRARALEEGAAALAEENEGLREALASLRRLSQDADLEVSEAVTRLKGAEQRSRELDERLFEACEQLERSRAESIRLEDALAEAQAAAERAERRAAEMEGAASELTALKDRMADTARRIEALEQAEQEVARLRPQVVALRREATEAGELRVRLERAQAEEQSLRSRLEQATRDASETAEIQRKLAEAEAQVAELEPAAWENAALRERLRQTEGRIESLGSKLAEADRKVAEISSEAERSSAELKEARGRIAELEARPPGDSNALARAQEIAAAEKIRADRLDRERARAEKELEQAERRAAQAEENAKRADEESSRLKASLSKESSSARDAEGRARNAEALARSAEERARSAETRRRAAETRAMEASARAQHAERRLQEAERKVEQPDREHEDRAPLEARVAALEQALADRDSEVKRLAAVADRATQDLDEARAEVGRKLAELKENREGQTQLKRQLERLHQEADTLRSKLSRSGDAALLKEDLDRRDQEIARLRAEASSAAAEKTRLRSMIESSEQNQVQLERRIAELETSLAESNQRAELLKRDLSERSERLRRLSSGINEGG